DEIAERFGSGNFDSDARAAVVARFIRDAFDAWRPSTRGIAATPRVELVDVLPSGRDVFDLDFDGAAVVRIEVVAGLGDTPAAVSVDGVCRDAGRDSLLPCMVWRRFGSQAPDGRPGPSDAETGAQFTAHPRLFRGEASPLRIVSGPWALQLSVEGC